jgi:hypothetical protein
MRTGEIVDNKMDAETEKAQAVVGTATKPTTVTCALQFAIGDRTYWLSRSRDGNAWRIVANGDLIEHASILHYGDVAAFHKMATRLQEIEKQWADAKK